MRTETFFPQRRDELFENAPAMHDCAFTVSYEGEVLVLVFEHLERYVTVNGTPRFGEARRLTVRYRFRGGFSLFLRFGRREKCYFDTVFPLSGREAVMYKYALDSFGGMTLFFSVMLGKRLWGGELELSPDEIEYLWEGADESPEAGA